MKTTLFNRLTAGLLAAVLCLSVLAGCAAKPQKELTRYSTIFYDVFDTVTQVIAYCESEEEFTKQMEALHADLISYNQLYDIYNDYDGVVNVKTINDNAGKAPVQVDDRILSMLELAQKMYDTTNGKLNVAMGSVLNIWHNYREAAESHQNEADNTLPTQEELEAAAQHCDINNVVIDEQAKTVYLADPEMSLDVGSVGKGYAVEMVCQAAQARGLTSALVSVGGNLRAIGKKPDGSQWTGGVENPWNASEVYTTDSLFGAAINTVSYTHLQAEVQAALEGAALGVHGMDGGQEDLFHALGGDLRGVVGVRGNGAHAAGVQAGVVVVGTLVVHGRHHGLDHLAVGKACLLYTSR